MSQRLARLSRGRERAARARGGRGSGLRARDAPARRGARGGGAARRGRRGGPRRAARRGARARARVPVRTRARPTRDRRPPLACRKAELHLRVARGARASSFAGATAARRLPRSPITTRPPCPSATSNGPSSSTCSRPSRPLGALAFDEARTLPDRARARTPRGARPRGRDAPARRRRVIARATPRRRSARSARRQLSRDRSATTSCSPVRRSASRRPAGGRRSTTPAPSSCSRRRRPRSPTATRRCARACSAASRVHWTCGAIGSAAALVRDESIAMSRRPATTGTASPRRSPARTGRAASSTNERCPRCCSRLGS